MCCCCCCCWRGKLKFSFRKKMSFKWRHSYGEFLRFVVSHFLLGKTGVLSMNTFPMKQVNRTSVATGAWNSLSTLPSLRSWMRRKDPAQPTSLRTQWNFKFPSLSVTQTSRKIEGNPRKDAKSYAPLIVPTKDHANSFHLLHLHRCFCWRSRTRWYQSISLPHQFTFL